MSEIKVDPLEAIARGLVDEFNRHDIQATVVKHVGYWTIACQHWHDYYSYIKLCSDHIKFNTYSPAGRMVDCQFRYEDPQLLEQLVSILNKSNNYSRDGERGRNQPI